MARRMKYTFFSPDETSARRYAEKINKDWEHQTGRQLKGTVSLSSKQMKHKSGWKTWEY